MGLWLVVLGVVLTTKDSVLQALQTEQETRNLKSENRTNVGDDTIHCFVDENISVEQTNPP
jgi:hypothetical protein